MIYFQNLDIRAYVIIYFIISCFGLCIGSFLNVCIFRLPAGESLTKKSSHCMKCGAKIHWYDLFPVFSWLFLKGKCRNCGDKISGRYPLVESLNWLVYLLALTFLDVEKNPLNFVLTALFFSVLIVISFIDIDTQEILANQFVLLAILGVASCFTNTLSIKSRIIGALCISVPFFIIGEVSSIFIKKKTGEKIRGIELGDTVLMLFSGFFLGTKNIIVSAFVGLCAAAIIGMIMKAKGKDSKIAFAPYLSFGMLVGSLFGTAIMNCYLSFLQNVSA